MKNAIKMFVSFFKTTDDGSSGVVKSNYCFNLRDIKVTPDHD